MDLSKNNCYINFVVTFLSSLLFFSCNKSSESFQVGNNRVHEFNEIAYYSRATTDGGLIVLSSQFLIKNIDENEKSITTYLSKINSEGKKSWTIDFNSFKSDYNYFFPKTANILKDGGFIVIAQYSTTDSSSKNLLLIKGDANRTIVLTKELFPDGSWESPYFDIIQTSDTLFALANGNKIYEYRMDSSRNYLWAYENTAIFESYLSTSQDGGIIITRSSHGNGPCSRLKINSTRDAISWQKNEDVSNNVWRQTSIAALFENDFVIAGSNYNTSGNLDFYLETFSENGDSKTFKQIPGILNEYCHFVLRTGDGGFLLIGTTTQTDVVLFDDEVFPDFNARILAVKLDAAMNVEWTKTYSGDYGSKGVCANETPEGNFLLLGNQVSFSNPNVINMTVLKINKDGGL